jgi:hypothetical protein
MKARLIITDVTRMSGQRVCVAGIDREGKSYRPILDDGDGHISEEWLYDDSGPVIFPFSCVEFDLLKHIPDAPHTEDWIVDSEFKRLNSTCTERRELLEKIADESVTDIFDAEIQHNPGSYIREGDGDRSLGTVEAQVIDCFYGISFDNWDYRITFTDCVNQRYSLKVTDLSFRYYCDHLRDEEKLQPDKISAKLNKHLSSNATYLRIGLARPTWQKHPHCCFLQITGVYTFPDYLGGRCFADFHRPFLCY